MYEIGNRIKKRREALGMTQEDLALKLNYKSRSSINKIEASGRGLPQSKIVAFAKALNTTPSYLMGWEEGAGITISDIQVTGQILPVDNSLTLVEYKKRIPILGRISAGLPLLAVENIEGYENVEDPSLDYALIVKGDSMNGARIYEGDLVYVCKEVDYENGDIVIALINGYDATIKRFYRYNDEIILRPENPTMKEQHYKLDEVKLLGKVKAAKINF